MTLFRAVTILRPLNDISKKILPIFTPLFVYISLGLWYNIISKFYLKGAIV